MSVMLLEAAPSVRIMDPEAFLNTRKHNNYVYMHARILLEYYTAYKQMYPDYEGVLLGPAYKINHLTELSSDETA